VCVCGWVGGGGGWQMVSRPSRPLAGSGSSRSSVGAKNGAVEVADLVRLSPVGGLISTYKCPLPLFRGLSD
jgi:hypothetical protein